ncbi:response regulator transcription factor [Catenovulum sp. SM1970]|uniref:response regulator transcription factor n=1 Tax=Marinifaba aquimaris TaxID=2741323 RepID=UPI001574A522|nr:response regulator transcription factor [Marinifaba aquimaris]NTS75510.1 response regulator transcription factor [Marinifaba aquimaris]
MKSILLVEDDKIISTAISKQLEKKGYLVYQAFKGDSVMRMLIRHAPDCVLLDIGLPNRSGFSVCADLKTFYKGPVLFLTAQDSPEVEVTCFKLGADDFISKSAPFSVLYQRIKRLLEPMPQEQVDKQNRVEIGGLVIDKKSYQCKFFEQDVPLTNEEFELLFYLALQKNELVTRDNIYITLKGITYDGISRGVDISISRIREKLNRVGINKQVVTSVRGKGYILKSSILENEVLLDTA